MLISQTLDKLDTLGLFAWRSAYANSSNRAST
jgi:hypothetical protein